MFQRQRKASLFLATLGLVCAVAAGSIRNPSFTEQKIKNYLPHMSWPEVEDLLKRTDVAVIPIGSLEQHGPHLDAAAVFLKKWRDLK